MRLYFLTLIIFLNLKDSLAYSQASAHEDSQGSTLSSIYPAIFACLASLENKSDPFPQSLSFQEGTGPYLLFINKKYFIANEKNIFLVNPTPRNGSIYFKEFGAEVHFSNSLVQMVNLQSKSESQQTANLQEVQLIETSKVQNALFEKLKNLIQSMSSQYQNKLPNELEKTKNTLKICLKLSQPENNPWYKLKEPLEKNIKFFSRFSSQKYNSKESTRSSVPNSGNSVNSPNSVSPAGSTHSTD